MVSLWPYTTPGIPDALFEQLPGIPMSKQEVRLLVLGYLRLKADSLLWDVGAGTGTIAIEAALLCPTGQVIAVERDQEVANLIRHNCDRFQVSNVEVIEGSAPECLPQLPQRPDCILIEGGRPLQATVGEAWRLLKDSGRVVVTVSSLENLYQVSESFSKLQVRNIEVVQAAVNRLEVRGYQQAFVAVDPIFVFSGEKLD
ncbi:MAG: precorrin-6Y C5,15-methyltransferase subunit CbiT [Leptolyngbyaceae cyanobacterium SM1_1_3]|nr:precorrin-6Y C5,15-methyltransferase subunit CbiT [Leptolyngbyaceae cyanobacterium SM1_1_3]NJM85668.1 precorrin-6Y C5,15-methyltransferase subunit CbiT [Leptolyngbyaceae cyanobacterium RM2_2_21]NJN03049.1 precorrin-6Y C5,15-methyltransferase subunit CbiT [Leptolyngbyaceae cyanobacterium RM1_1_2]NJO08729.1 precorrin-6Y C5,15-methyltransferase subunit CbiT [Leptolyngbyaceae cyanobacterium SL_1_1]